MINTTDPVCGMKVESEAKPSVAYQDKQYHFCSQKCLDKFQANPDAYLHPPAAAEKQTVSSANSTAPSAPASGAYTCPMHPEVRQAQPGSCPKCGMTLERVNPVASGTTEYTCPMHPEVVSDQPGSCPKCGMALEPRNGHSDDTSELDDMTRRFWFSTLLALPVFVLAMVADLLPQFMPLAMPVVQWLEFALSTPVVCGAAGRSSSAAGLLSINRSLNMFTLISLGVGVAWSLQRGGDAVAGYFSGHHAQL